MENDYRHRCIDPSNYSNYNCSSKTHMISNLLI